MTSVADDPAARIRATIALGRRFDLVVLHASPGAARGILRGTASVDPGRGWLPLRTEADLEAFPESVFIEGRPWILVDGQGKARRLLLVTIEPALEREVPGAVSDAMMRLNLVRNRLFRSGGVLLLAGGDWMLSALTDRAKDTFSVRSLVLTLDGGKP